MKLIYLLLLVPILAYSLDDNDTEYKRHERNNKHVITDNTSKTTTVSNGTLNTTKDSTVKNHRTDNTYTVDRSSSKNLNGQKSNSMTITNTNANKSYTAQGSSQEYNYGNGKLRTHNETVTNNQSGQSRTVNSGTLTSTSHANTYVVEPTTTEVVTSSSSVIPVVTAVGAGAAIVGGSQLKNESANRNQSPISESSN